MASDNDDIKVFCIYTFTHPCHTWHYAADTNTAALKTEQNKNILHYSLLTPPATHALKYDNSLSIIIIYNLAHYFEKYSTMKGPDVIY